MLVRKHRAGKRSGAMTQRVKLQKVVRIRRLATTIPAIDGVSDVPRGVRGRGDLPHPSCSREQASGP